MKKNILLLGCLSLVGLVPVAANAQVLASTNSRTQQSRSAEWHEHPKMVALKSALNDIERQYKVSFIYRSDIIDTQVLQPDLRAGLSLENELRSLLAPSGLTFEKVRSNFYIILSNDRKKQRTLKKLKNVGFHDPSGIHPISAQSDLLVSRVSNMGLTLRTSMADLQVKGRVTAEEGYPLPGVSVVVKGTQVGTTTDADGQFSLRTPETGTLVFSFIGYQSLEVPVNNRSVIDVRMRVDVRSLDEVVVVGYGSVKRTDLVSSVAVANRKDFGDVNVTNVGQLLQGKLAGVQVVNDNGLPGAGTRIVVRGTGSFTNANPLYVIDGIQGGDINSVSPNDIESITVLKDASSVAIYGAQGANGVVIVTTKRAKAGVPRVSYNGYYGLSQPWRKLDLLNAAQYVDLVKEIQNNNVPAKLNTPDVLVDRTDWQNEIFRTARLTEHYLNLAGGTEKVLYNASMSYTNQDAILIDRNFQRAFLRLNVEENIFNNKVRLGQTINFRYTVEQGNLPSFLDAIRMPPYAPTRDPNNLGGFSRVTTIEDVNDAYNPLTGVYLSERRNRDFLTLMQVYGEADFLKYFKWRTQASFNFSNYQNYNYQQANQNGNLTNANGISENYGWSINPLVENILSFNKQFGVHNLSVTAGNTYNSGGRYRNISLNGSEFPNDDIRSVAVAPQSAITGGGAGVFALLSYFGRIQYSLLDRYLLTASIRRDGSPAFSEAYRFGNFPAVGVAWKIHEEPFMKANSLFSELKLRASLGKTGNANIGYFRTETNVWRGQSNNIVYSLGDDKTFVQGSTVNAIPNPNIRWEETVQTDIGLDVGLLNNRVTATFDYYNRNNNGLLVDVFIPLSVGAGGPYDRTGKIPLNAATAFNRGFEAALGFNGGGNNDFRYNITANVAYNKNQVTSLGTEGGVPIVSGGFDGVSSMTRTAPGYPIGAFWGFVVDRVASTKAEVNALGVNEKGESTYQTGLMPGDIIFRDLNGDGKVTEADQTFLGSPIPKWQYGANINLNYKGFDFMTAFQGLAGVQLVNAMTYWLEGTTRPFNGSTSLLNRWRREGDVSDIPKAGQNANGNLNLRPSDRFVESGNFLRVRNVTLGYTLPRTMLGKTSQYISNLRVYLTAQNLLTFTKYTGYDPEIGTGNNGGNDQQFLFERGVDRGQYPQPRTFLLGLQVGF